MRTHETRLIIVLSLLAAPVLLWPLRGLFTLERFQSAGILAGVIAATTSLAVGLLMLVGRLWTLLNRP